MTAIAFQQPAREALRRFGIEPVAVNLAAQAENVTFKVLDKGGLAYTLRFHRPGYHALEELEAERLWTIALSQAGINVPEAVSAPDGRHYLDMEIPELGQRRWVGLARWVEGEILLPIVRDPKADAERICAHFRSLGELIAAMHNQAALWQPPGNFHRRRLDANGLAGPEPFWGRFWEHQILTADEKRLFIRVRDSLHDRLSVYGQDNERFSVIHADLHPGNIIVNGDMLAAIDFDDTAFGWHMFDIAVALHQFQDLPLFPQFYAALINGYCEVRPVSESDLEMVPTFLLMRGLAEIGWFGDRPENTTPDEMIAMKDFVVAQSHAFEAGTLTAEYRRSRPSLNRPGIGRG